MEKSNLSTIPHVAFIDSGIGGLSILSEVKKAIPAMQVSYFMDNRYLPYGELSTQSLLERLTVIVEFLQRLQPDLVVIACNTASTQSLDYLRQRFDIPFVGVVPAIKPAAKYSINKHIGLLATPATVKSDYIKSLAAQYAADCQLVSLGSSEVVACAEQVFWQSEQCQQLLPDLSCFAEVDTLVLGCTHFPLISELILKQLPRPVKLVDPGEAIARRVKDLLVTNTKKARDVSFLFCSSKLAQSKVERLQNYGFTGIELVDV